MTKFDKDDKSTHPPKSGNYLCWMDFGRGFGRDFGWAELEWVAGDKFYPRGWYYPEAEAPEATITHWTLPPDNPDDWVLVPRELGDDEAYTITERIDSWDGEGDEVVYTVHDAIIKHFLGVPR